MHKAMSEAQPTKATFVCTVNALQAYYVNSMNDYYYYYLLKISSLSICVYQVPGFLGVTHLIDLCHPYLRIFSVT